MQNKFFQNKTDFFFIIVCICLFMILRTFESQLFYDPFLDYFKGDYQKSPLPEFKSGMLFLGLIFRFFLNTTISLAILYILFRDREMVVFAAFLYFLLFLILIIAFFSILYFYKNEENLTLFYVRRFLIQPLFLMLFASAFYFQKQKKNDK